MANDDIRGTITDQNGTPVEGATVYLFSEDSPNIVETATTDANGAYVFTRHGDGDGTTQTWHVAAVYEDATGTLFNTFSKPGVEAALVAIPNDEIDFFEDGDIAEYSGNVGAFAVQTATVKEGNYALEGSMSSGNAVAIRSATGLPHYPERGDEIRLWVRFSGDQPAPGFAWAQTNNGADRYIIDYRDDSGEWRLRSRVNDSPTTLDSFSDDGTQGVWYFVWVREYLPDGTISATIYDGDPTDDTNEIGTLSANNLDHDTGEIELSINDSSGGSSTVFIDGIAYA